MTKKAMKKQGFGEPYFLEIVQYRGSDLIETACYEKCCGCGYTHLVHYRLREEGKRLILEIRPFGNPDTWPKRKRKR